MSREDEIRARVAVALDEYPLPWVAKAEGIDGGVYSSSGYMVVGGERHEGYMHPDEPVAILIANAPADLRFLLDRVKELEAALETQAVKVVPTGVWMAPASEVSTARAELATRSNQLVEAMNRVAELEADRHRPQARRKVADARAPNPGTRGCDGE